MNHCAPSRSIEKIELFTSIEIGETGLEWLRWGDATKKEQCNAMRIYRRNSLERGWSGVEGRHEGVLCTAITAMKSPFVLFHRQCFCFDMEILYTLQHAPLSPCFFSSVFFFRLNTYAKAKQKPIAMEFNRKELLNPPHPQSWPKVSTLSQVIYQ